MKSIVIVSALSLFATSAFAVISGSKGGGGGAAWVCRDKISHAITRIETVDLWEAANDPEMRLTVVRDNTKSPQTQIEEAASQPSPALNEALLSDTKLSDEMISVGKIPAASKVSKVDDAELTIEPKEHEYCSK